jgi:cell division protein FtsL
MGDSIPARLALATVLVATAFLLYLAQASQASVISLNIEDQQMTRSQLTVENANLHESAATYQSLTRISAAAAGPLHMNPPGTAPSVWLRPVIVRIQPPRDTSHDLAHAETQSQPLFWMKHALSVIESSL